MLITGKSATQSVENIKNLQFDPPEDSQGCQLDNISPCELLYVYTQNIMYKLWVNLAIPCEYSSKLLKITLHQLFSKCGLLDHYHQ